MEKSNGILRIGSCRTNGTLQKKAGQIDGNFLKIVQKKNEGKLNFLLGKNCFV